MGTVAEAQELRIEAARKLLKPASVDQGKVPGWFRLALMRGWGADGYDTSGHGVLWHAVEKSKVGYANWLDHWGASHERGRRAFVSEPYHLTCNDALSIEALVSRMDGIHWGVSSNSWWYPGSTIRVYFCEDEKRGV